MLPALCATGAFVLLLCAAGTSAANSPGLTCTLRVTDASGAPISSVAQGQSVTLTTTITNANGGLPSGTVSYARDGYAISGPESFTRSGSTGTDVLTTQSLPPGTYGITSTYASKGDDLLTCTTAAWQITTAEPPQTITHTELTLTPNTFSSNEQSIHFVAHVWQDGAQITPAGGQVTFRVVSGKGQTGTELGRSPLINGYASFDKGGFDPGTYVFEADYTGDNVVPSWAQATLTSDASSRIAYTGPPTAQAGGQVVLAARLTDQSGAIGLAGDTVMLSLRGTNDACTTTTGPGGVASCTVVVHGGAGPATVDVSFGGDDSYGASTGTGTLLVLRGPVALAYTGDLRGSAGRPVQLAATLLTSAGVPIAGQPVTLTLNGAETCTVRTSTEGLASCHVTAHELPGTYPVTARFAGSADYLPGDAPAATIDIVASVPTSLEWAGSTTVAAGAPGTIAFQLASDGAPVAGVGVAITYGGVTTTVRTDANGIATWPDTVTHRLGGSVDATAAFAGAPGYDPSNGSGSFTVSPADATLTLDAVDHVVRTDPVTLTATLAAGGGGVPGEHLTLWLGTQSCTTGATGDDGRASCTIPSVTAPLGTATTAAAFVGDEHATTAHASGATTVDPIPTTLVLAPVAPVQVGRPATLSATLTRTGAGPIVGETVTLTLGSQQCSDTTQSSGLATCTIPHITQQPSKQPVSADLPADDTYAQAHADGTAIVYDFAPGGGFFAVAATPHVGDAVTFWGSQWARRNPIDAPSSFKGFVDATATPMCGAAWTTRPGNSTPPPAGPLPQYMAIVASRAIGKKGSAITGDVQSIVIVQTSAGYAPDPGHAGTGVVVATICG